MANSSLVLSSLDFDTLKQNFKNFLTSQSVFKDYNFDASNMSVLLDVMSYNSYLNSFYLNMVASEMFLDTAQKLDSVVSHAKELNYIPRSSRSSEASISFTISTTGINSPFSIPKGTRFSGSNSNGIFTFTTSENYAYTSPNSTFTVANLVVYEGTYFQDTYIIDYNNETQKFTMSNQNIDLDSLTVTVTENGSNTIFNKVSTLFNVDSTSNVYFIQATQNNQYELLFGDGLFGRVPVNGSVVQLNYRITNGTDADGVTSFICDQDLGVINNGNALVSSITVVANSSSSANAEGIESIRFAAPRYFATQQRAVASDDYSSLVLSEFGGQVSDVNVYGGETLEPKQYGRVVVAVKPSSGVVAPDYLKSEISAYLKNYIALPNRVIISDPDYIYCGINTTVQYDSSLTLNTQTSVQSIITNNIKTFSSTYLEKFANDFRYSKFVAMIDSSEPSIVSNDTSIEVIKRISPLINYPTSYTLYFTNPADIEPTNPLIGYNPYTTFSDEPAITSSSFTYVLNGVNYPSSYIRDDNTGNLVVYTDINGIFTILNPAAGTIDYNKGVLNLTNFTTSYYQNYISIYMSPLNKDILAATSEIILIDLNDVTVNVIQKTV